MATADSNLEAMAELLARVREGDTGARDRVFELCYPELKRLARTRLAGVPRSATLDTTALVHDVYLKIAKMSGLSLESRGHFMAYAAHAMRTLIIDILRARAAEVRGGDAPHLTLDTDLSERIGAGTDRIIEVHEALEELAQVDARLVQVVEMRYFAGYSEAEIGASLGVTERTVRRDWHRARALLAAALRA